MIELKSVAGSPEALAIIIEKDSLMEERVKAFYGCYFNRDIRHWMLSLHFYQQFIEKFSRFGIKHSPKAFEVGEEFFKWREELLELKAREDLPNYKQHCLLPLEKYQKIGAAYLVLAQKALLCFGTGVGKTFVSLEALCLNYKLYNKGSAIIFTLSSAKLQWRDEIKRAFPQITSFVLSDGDSKQREKNYKEFQKHSGLKVLILNYEILLRDYKKIQNIHKDILILDEVSRLKSKKTKIRAQIRDGKVHTPLNGFTIKGSFLQLKCSIIWGLSATPVEVGLQDLYSIFNCVKPSLFVGGYNRFAERFLLTNFWGKPEGEQNIPELLEVVSPFMMTKFVDLKLDVKVEDVFLEMGIEQRNAYNKIKKEISQEVKNNPDVSKTIALQKLTKLRQICNYGDITIPEYLGPSVKSEWLINKIKEIPKEEKILIFSQWTETTNRICNALEREGIKFVHVKGGMSSKDKERQLNLVKNGDTNVIVATDCIAYAINLFYCNHCVIFDSPWNPARLTQKKGRVVRRGQEKKSYIYLLTCVKTVEEKLIKKLRERINLFKTVMGLEWKVDLQTSEIVQFLED